MAEARKCILGEAYKLAHPVEQEMISPTQTYCDTETEITLRRPVGKDLLLIDQYQGQPMKLVLLMISALSGWPLRMVEKIDAEDLGPLADAALPDAANGQETGETR